MDQEERRRAMLRQRGELSEETSKTRAPKKTSLSSRKLAARKRQQRQQYIRLGLYAGAVIIVILVIISLFTGGNEKNPKETDAIEAGATVGESEEISSQEEENESTLETTEETTEKTTEEPTTQKQTESNAKNPLNVVIPRWIEQNFIRINEFSRPCIALNEVKYIAIHWVGNPATTAINNRNYFDHLGDPEDPAYGKTHASAQFVIGLNGEIIQCMPLNELAYAVGDAYNPYTLSIEVCHPDWDGKFTDVTYQSLVKLTAWLMQQFNLDIDSVLRHYDCTEKECPKYYVTNPQAWEQLKQDIVNYSNSHPGIL
ncbi:MAG: N-acetylmuramoyl-L-alanine amidase [Lachnospiraceae bacterium]|nr:N-acetylmuramoyl-L-alanine amidase [Lachnospiraceae bacterium]